MSSCFQAVEEGHCAVSGRGPTPSPLLGAGAAAPALALLPLARVPCQGFRLQPSGAADSGHWLLSAGASPGCVRALVCCAGSHHPACWVSSGWWQHAGYWCPSLVDSGTALQLQPSPLGLAFLQSPVRLCPYRCPCVHIHARGHAVGICLCSQASLCLAPGHAAEHLILGTRWGWRSSGRGVWCWKP